jgi:membrane protease YdiL (CAAX protease family)
MISWMRVPWPVIIVALTLPTAGALVYFVVANPDSPLFKLAYAASKIAQFALPVIVLLAINRERLQSIRLSCRGVLGGIALGVVTIAAIWTLYFAYLRDSSLMSSVGAEVRAKVMGFGFQSPAGFVVLAAFLAIAHSFLEEYYWRWFVHSALRERLSSPMAIAVSSIAFAAHHVVVLAVYFPGSFWIATVPFSLGVAFGGACWAWWYDRTGCLAGPWAAHVLADVALMAIGFDLLYR